MLTFSVPIADWGRGKNRSRVALAELKGRKLYAENLQNQIIQEIREIVRTVNDASVRFSINRKNRDVAMKSFKVSQMRFQNGDISSRELAIAQEQLANVQLAFIESFITYRMSLTHLTRKTFWDFENNRRYGKRD
jgi:outer membrane protein TolC